MVVDPLRAVILRNGNPVSVEPRVMQLLVYLAGRPGEVVSKTELMEDVWRANVVDEAIHRGISLLRAALGDSSQASRIIETVPRRGYRLLIAPTPERSRRPGLLFASIALCALALAALLLALRPEAPMPAPTPAATVALPQPVADTTERAVKPPTRAVVARTASERPLRRVVTPAPEAIAPPAPAPQAREGTPPPEGADTAPAAPVS